MVVIVSGKYRCVAGLTHTQQRDTADGGAYASLYYWSAVHASKRSSIQGHVVPYGFFDAFWLPRDRAMSVPRSIAAKQAALAGVVSGAVQQFG